MIVGMWTTNGLRTGIGGSIRLTVACACLLLVPSTVRAQNPPEGTTSPPPSESPVTAPAVHHTNRLYLGMWTTHLKDPAIVLDNNWLLGVSFRGFFGATFVNSFDRRAFTGGLQRTIVSADRPHVGASLGYRLGFVTGYDGRFTRIARHTPVLPLVQPFVTIDVQRVGFEISYTFVVVSMAVSYKF